MPVNDVQPISRQQIRDGLGHDHVVGDHAEAPAEPGPAGRPGADRQHHLLGLDRAVFGPHHRRPRPSRPVTCVRSKMRTPRSRATRRSPRASRAGCTTAPSSIMRAPVIRGESAICRASSTAIGRIRSRESTRRQERRQARRRRAPPASRPSGSPMMPVVVEPRVDVVLAQPRADLTHRVGDRLSIAQALSSPNSPQMRLRRPTTTRRRSRRCARSLRRRRCPARRARCASPGPRARELDRGPQPGEPAAHDADVGGQVRRRGAGSARRDRRRAPPGARSSAPRPGRASSGAHRARPRLGVAAGSRAPRPAPPARGRPAGTAS